MNIATCLVVTILILTSDMFGIDRCRTFSAHSLLTALFLGRCPRLLHVAPLALSCNKSIGNRSAVCAIQLGVDCLRLLMGKLRAEGLQGSQALVSVLLFPVPMFAGGQS